ncbi:MAG: beta-ketoacyl-ACP synthase III [Saprospiraceae bacterium]
MLNATITGVQGWVPDTILTNKDLEKRVDTNDAWIRTRTGIEERRILGDGKGTSDMAVEAVSRLLAKTNTSKEEVDLVVFATVTPDMIMPDTANTLCSKLGLKNAFGFDLKAACSGFIYAITTASQFVKTGMYKKVVVVGGDKMTSIIDPNDRATCIIFGDGCGAVLLEPTEEEIGFRDAILRGDGIGREHLFIKAGGSLNPITAESLVAKENFVFQDGRPVFKAAVKGMSNVVKEIIKRNKLSQEDINWLVPHQANIRIINAVADQIDFPKEKVTINIHKYGNTTAATIPLCLWEWENQFKKGDYIILTAFGGGFTWGAVLIKWGYDPLN